MSDEELNAIRAQLMRAAQEMPGVDSVGAIEGEAAVFGIALASGDEVFVDIKPA